MKDKRLYTLKIDEGFKNLIRPLFRQEYLQLEANILSDGCRDPITVWDDVIIDGHNRYEICTKHSIPFAIEQIEFECREAAVAWICANQLGRRNLTHSTRKFLIGLQYESEKILNTKKNAEGLNQYTRKDSVAYSDELSRLEQELTNQAQKKTAQRIAEANHVSHGTVEKYAIFTRALEEIGKKEPKLVPKILSEQYKISHNAVVELSKLNESQIKTINKRLDRNKQSFSTFQTTRNTINSTALADSRVSQDNQVLSVKDMPKFDPDSEITALTLTIPSWESSITRVRNSSDLNIISDMARSKLQCALRALENTINDMLTAINED